MAAIPPALPPAPPVFATRKQIRDLTREYELITEGLSEESFASESQPEIYRLMEQVGDRVDPDIWQYLRRFSQIQRASYVSARAWFDLVGASSVFESSGPPSGVPDANMRTNIPIETYEKWDKHALKLVKLERDCSKVIADKVENLRWGIRLPGPGNSPPGAEGQGKPHMQRGEYWYAGQNRR
jgi:hypothetical protein